MSPLWFESPVQFGEQKGDSYLSLGGLDRHLCLKRGQMGWEKVRWLSGLAEDTGLPIPGNTDSVYKVQKESEVGDSRSWDVRPPHWSLWALLGFTELVGFTPSKGHR